MAQAILVKPNTEGLGATVRRDLWWAGPLATFLGLLAFLIYANAVVFLVPGNFEVRQHRGFTDVFFQGPNPTVAPYLAPFHAPLIYDRQSPHAWFQEDAPSWWPS